MTDGEEKLIEIMSLMLDEQRETRREVRSLKQITNDRLEAIEYALTHDTRELRGRLERAESRIAE